MGFSQQIFFIFSSEFYNKLTDVLKNANTKKILLTAIKYRKITYLGYLPREDKNIYVHLMHWHTKRYTAVPDDKQTLDLVIANVQETEQGI